MIGRVAGQGGLSIDGIIKEYTVLTGDNISAGQFVTLVNGQASNTQTILKTGTETTGVTSGMPGYVRAVAIDDTRIMMTWPEYNDGNKGYAMIVTLDGLSYTMGAKLAVTPNGVQAYGLHPSKIDDTRVLVSYRNASGYAVAQIINISGTTLTAGASTIINPASSYLVSATALDTSNGVVFYNDAGNGYQKTARAISFSGDVVSTAGDEVVVSNSTNSSNSANGGVITLDANTALTSYMNASNYHTLRVIYINSGVITLGSEYTVNATASSGYNEIHNLQGNFIGTKTYTSNRCHVRIYRWNGGTSLTAGNIATMLSYQSVYYSQFVPVSAEKVYLFYTTSGKTLYATEFNMNVNGYTIDSWTENNIGTCYNSVGAAAPIGGSNICYLYASNSSPYNGNIGTLDPEYFEPRGVAKQNGSGGDTITVFEPEV